MDSYQRLEETLEGVVLESSYSNDSYSLLTAKTRVHDHQKMIQDIEHAMGQTDNPKRRQALQARLHAEHDKLKKAQDTLHSREQAFSKHKSTAHNISTPHRYNNPSHYAQP